MEAKGKGLEERTAQFAARVVNVCEAIPAERLKSGHLKDQLFMPRIQPHGPWFPARHISEASVSASSGTWDG